MAVCHKINYIYKPIISFNFTGMKKTLLPILCTVCFHIQAQLREQTNLNDSLVIENIFSEEPKRFFEKEGVKMSIAPALLFTASGLTWGEKEQIREIRNRYIPNYHFGFDDYLQYAPGLATYGLKLSGVKGRNKLGRSAVSHAASLGIMAIIVNSIKYTAKVERPDGSTRNSFPSGHTANAYTNASFMHKEYGIKNPAYSIAGYSMATFTGFGRNLNNRHWVPDVLAGAGIGILSTELAYFFVDKFYGNKGDNLSMFSKIEGNGHPSFLSLKAGAALATTNFLKESKLDKDKERGFELGIEGAYFFSPNWGIGGSLSLSSFPVHSVELEFDDPDWGNLEIVTQSLGFVNYGLGPYFAYDFSDNWQLMLKSLAGYSSAASGKVFVKNEQIDLPNHEYQVANYKPSNSFRWTNGASITYKFNPGLGVSAYVDYHHSNSEIYYTFNEEIKDDEVLNEIFNDGGVKEKINYFTFGLKLTAYF